MTKILTRHLQQGEETAAAPLRTYEPEEFDADTDEDRPVAILAEKRRRFLAELNLHRGAAQSGTAGRA